MSNRFTADFGRTSDDYSRHRAGFPAELLTRLTGHSVGLPGQRILDLGTGTGTLARGFARRGAVVTGIDVSEPMLEKARAAAAEEGADVVFRTAPAEATGLAEAAFDAVTAGQCWHWFDGPGALAEADRVLVAGGRLVICYFSWMAHPGSVAEATERLILDHNPDWPYAGDPGVHPSLLKHVAAAGFTAIETFSFDVDQAYSHAGWRGRVRASAGVGGSLSADRVAAFDAELGAVLAERFPGEPLAVAHRCWALVCRKPAAPAPGA